MKKTNRHEVRCYNFNELQAVIENLREMEIDFIEDDSNDEYILIVWYD